jgi:hypothetical protein
MRGLRPGDWGGGLPSTARRVRQAARLRSRTICRDSCDLAASAEIIITRHGKPAGVLIGFENEDDWLDYRHDT